MNGNPNMTAIAIEANMDAGPRINTLGKVQLHHEDTHEVILVPTPSGDPKDPLNWPNAQKYYLAGLVCVGVFFVNFVAAAPAVAIAEIAVQFFGEPKDSSDAVADISKVAYIQTGASLMIGIGNLIWVPLAIKYGRRPVYVAAWLLMTGGCAKSFPSELTARIVYGLAGAAPEIVATLVLTDLFFLHQRGAVMVLYTCALTAGVGAGIVIGGLLTIDNSWQMMYWVCTAFIGICTILVALTLPETSYRRQVAISRTDDSDESKKVEGQEEVVESAMQTTKRGFHWDLRVSSSTYTHESLLTLILRPVIALLLPAVLWASLVNAVTIGVIILISVNFSSAFSATYGFRTWQSGLTYVSSIVGALVAILCGGWMTDMVTGKLTIRYRGVRTPEMRLPIMIIPLVTGPLACMLYGVGIARSLHWICPVIGLGLGNISLVYILDSYRPIAGEVVVTQTVFRAVFGFLLNFYANPWINQQGYIQAFGILAGISGAIFLLSVVFYVLGDRLRTSSWNWPVIRRYLHWDGDREVGE